MKRQKGIAPIIVLVIIGALALFVPVINQNIVAAINNNPNDLCTDLPFAAACICPAGLQKTETENGWTCQAPIIPVDATFPLSRDDPQLNQKIVDHAKDVLRERFPACVSIDCVGAGYILDYGCSSDFTVCKAECSSRLSPITGTLHWSVTMRTSDGFVPINWDPVLGNEPFCG